MVVALATGWGGVGLNHSKQTDVRFLWATGKQSRWCPTLIFRPATCLLYRVPWILHTPQWKHGLLLPAFSRGRVYALGPTSHRSFSQHSTVLLYMLHTEMPWFFSHSHLFTSGKKALERNLSLPSGQFHLWSGNSTAGRHPHAMAEFWLYPRMGHFKPLYIFQLTQN